MCSEVLLFLKKKWNTISSYDTYAIWFVVQFSGRTKAASWCCYRAQLKPELPTNRHFNCMSLCTQRFTALHNTRLAWFVAWVLLCFFNTAGLYSLDLYEISIDKGSSHKLLPDFGIAYRSKPIHFRSMLLAMQLIRMCFRCISRPSVRQSTATKNLPNVTACSNGQYFAVMRTRRRHL
jgi:hypothetical protein